MYVDGALSDPLEVDVGVPQGSILGPLLYILYTNDLPESVHSHLSENSSFFNANCKKCGNICCYADDSTLSISGKDPKEITENIAEKYKKIASYMNQNKLVLNGDKTHLLIMASSNKHRRHQDFGITLETGTKIIEPISSEKLLGAKLSNNFTWNLHIRDDDHSMFRTLTSKINALYKVSLMTGFLNRKMVASGLILSTLTYIMQVYGGCSGYLLTMLQVLQTKACRIVTKLPWMTPTSVLLAQCGWLSVRQLFKYQSLVLMFKIKSDKKPVYLYDRIGAKPGRVTRQEEDRITLNFLKEDIDFETVLCPGQ